MIRALTCFLLLFSPSVILCAQEDTAYSHPLEGKAAPGFQGSSMQGAAISLEALKGKVVVLNFWATWCKPCRMEFGKLNKLVEKYKGQDVVFLSITTDSKEEAEALLKKKKLNTTVIPSSKKILELYKVQMLPTNIVIDKEGKITGALVGYTPEVGEEIGNMIEKCLKK
jgi:thiol-disulfide isomerase/thioredoxin